MVDMPSNQTKLANYAIEDLLQDLKPNLKLLNEMIYATTSVTITLK